MDAQQIRTFIDAMAASDLQELEVSHEGWTLRLVRGNGSVRTEPPRAPLATVPAAASSERPAPRASEDAAAAEVRAPMFGVVHWQQAPGEPPFVKAGDVIEPGQMLCTIEAMKVFNEVRAERGGRVAAILVGSGTEVEAGQPLLTIEQVEHV